MKAILPVCTAHQPYDKITIAVVPASDGETCSFGDYNDYVDEMMETGGHMMHLHKANGTTIEESILKPCSDSRSENDFCYQGNRGVNHTVDDTTRQKTHAYFEH